MKRVFLKDSENRPLYFVFIFSLIAAACILFPTEWLAGLIGKFNAMALVRTVFGAAGIFLIILCGKENSLKLTKAAFKNSDIFIAGLLIAVNNFPIIALATEQVAVTASVGEFASYIFLCFSVGFFEEVFFRGLIFTMLLIYYKNHKYGAFWAVVLSSALFGLMHIINLLGGASIGAVLLQVGYTFLNGMLYAVIFYMTKTLWAAVLCHSIFDIGGLLINYKVASGTLWDTPTVILTVIISAIVIIWLIFRFAKTLQKETATNI